MQSHIESGHVGARVRRWARCLERSSAVGSFDAAVRVEHLLLLRCCRSRVLLTIGTARVKQQTCLQQRMNCMLVSPLSHMHTQGLHDLAYSACSKRAAEH
jgi:hypothetical protein